MPARTPYQTLLGERYDLLHSHVRAAHEAITAEGRVDVVHGTHLLTPFFIRTMKLPAAGQSSPVRLQVVIDHAPADGPDAIMMWMRQIGATRLDTRQFARRGQLVETAGPGSVEFRLRADEGVLVYESERCRFLGVPMPRALSPAVRARVSPSTDGWHVHVVIEWRRHLICTYGGEMRRVTRAS